MRSKNQIKYNKARTFRLHGESLGQIAKKLKVAKSSVFLWVQDIPIPFKLTKEYRKQNQKNNKKPLRIKKGIPALEPYLGRTLYTTVNKQDRRKHALLIKEKIKKRIIHLSYAKYLMEVSLKRKLKNNEHVDHINDNPLDDRMENLQILTCKENNKKSRRHRKISRRWVTLICPICKKQIDLPENQTYLVKKTKNTTCSKKCAGKLASKTKTSLKYRARRKN